MKRFNFIHKFTAVGPICAALLCCCLPIAAQARNPKVASAETTSVQIVWPDGDLDEGSIITVSFPEAMVAAENLGTGPSPLRIQPALAGTWVWKSQTEGAFKVGPAILPGQEFEFLLKPGLKDLQGAVIKAEPSLGKASSRAFKVAAEFDEGDQPLRPSGQLTFTYAVKASQVAAAVYFQDRDNRRRFPVEAVVSGTEEVASSITVRPRADLPKGRTFDLIVEGIAEAKTGFRLPELFVKAVGVTEPLKVLNIYAVNRALEPAKISLDFNDWVDVAEGAKIKILPAVEGLKCIVGKRQLNFEGPFDPHQRYTVTVPASVTGNRGYPMVAESRWGASFHLKKPAVVFPDQEFERRSRLGFRFPLIQINSGELKWRLAQVPPEKFVAIEKRLREFDAEASNPLNGEVVIDPETGWPVWKPTELLIEASRLRVLAEGTLEGPAEDVETRREIVWKPGEQIPAGPCLLEVTGTNAQGKIIGNRALVSFTEVGAVVREFGGEMALRVCGLGDGKPLAGVKVRAVTAENQFRGEAVTDADGIASFPKARLFPLQQDSARWFLIESAEGLMFQPVRGQRYYADLGGYGENEASGRARMAIVTDRPLYRPGHTVKFKGFLRLTTTESDRLRVPDAEEIKWRITRNTSSDDDRSAVASGSTSSDGFGGFEGEWKIPATVALGHYQLTAASANNTKFSTTINIQEFRPPPFSVTLKPVELPGENAGLRIESAYFHGAPNSGAKVKWSAIWSRLLPKDISEDEDLVVSDEPHGASGRQDKERVAGEGALAPDGSLELKVPQPFTDGYPRGWFNVNWEVEVTGSEAQTITEPVRSKVYAVPVALAVTASELAGKKIEIEAQAYGPDEAEVPGTEMTVEIFHVITKSVKEQIAPYVYHYVNTTRYQKVTTLPAVSPFKAAVAVKEQGNYIVAVRHATNPAVPTDLDRASVSGDAEDAPAQFAQRNETVFTLKADKESYEVGRTAVLSVQAPFTGTGWVSIEASGRILAGYPISLDANAGRLEIPVKAEYFPNVWVNVYLLHPGGADRVPAERFGTVKLLVEKPELELKVEPLMAAKEVRPGQPVSGQIVVTSQGAAVAGADVTAFAVDEAILVAGGWAEPKLGKEFYLPRAWGVDSFLSGLEQLVDRSEEASLTQKGFIIGDGGDGSLGPKKPVRKDFLPMAFWQTGLRTGADGKAAINFKAPDSLTRYRIIALVQTKESQFGQGSGAVEVSKPVQIEPALPRFVRAGDEVEIRAIVRQKMADSLNVTLHCATTLKLEGEASQSLAVLRNEPAVFRFHAKAGEGEAATVSFDTDAGPGDAVEVSFPVHPPTLLRKEAVFQTLGAEAGAMAALVPARWDRAVGVVDVTLSTSPWLPKLTGLPLLLEYPHGCFEQISSRILGYTVLGDLLAYLPDTGAHDREYRKRVEDGLLRMNAALRPEGFLPYWAGSTTLSAFPTIAGYWAAASAAKSGWSVPEKLLKAMPGPVAEIAEGKINDGTITPFHRCLALMVLAETGADTKRFEPVLQDLYLRREKLNEESRALLAVAMHRFSVLPKESNQLLREIDRPITASEFDPDTFSSTTRTEAMRAWAFASVHPEEKESKTRKALLARIGEMLESSRSLSTQENFWLLLAFRAMHAPVQAPQVDFSAAAPVPAAVSVNKASALWPARPIESVRKFVPVIGGKSLAGLTCLMDAQFRMQSAAEDGRTGRGLRVERVVVNRTEPSRTGSAEAPYQLGDELMVTIRLISPKLQHYVAVEGELPACLETVNPNLPAVARSFTAPVTAAGDTALSLSYSELRDRTTCLYFNRVEPGSGVYATVARVTTAGTFQWPPTQAAPMYDSRFSGVSAAGVCHVVAK